MSTTGSYGFIRRCSPNYIPVSSCYTVSSKVKAAGRFTIQTTLDAGAKFGNAWTRKLTRNEVFVYSGRVSTIYNSYVDHFRVLELIFHYVRIRFYAPPAWRARLLNFMLVGSCLHRLAHIRRNFYVRPRFNDYTDGAGFHTKDCNSVAKEHNLNTRSITGCYQRKGAFHQHACPAAWKNLFCIQTIFVLRFRSVFFGVLHSRKLTHVVNFFFCRTTISINGILQRTTFISECGRIIRILWNFFA